MFKRFLSLAAALAATGLALSAQALGPEKARALLRDCDAARGNLDGVRWEIVLTEESGGQADRRRIEVKAKGFDMVAETLSPPRQKGHKLLLVQNNMWFHKPGLSKPVPVSLRQKLAGRAANGDIAATNYAEDYEVASIVDEAYADEPAYRFDLKAREGSATYARIRYWISKERRLGLYAEYLNADGSKVLKTAEMDYANEVEFEGSVRPFISEMRIVDGIEREAVTRIEFSQPELGEISPREFSLQRFTR